MLRYRLITVLILCHLHCVVMQRSPLAKACYFGHADVVHFLLEKEAHVKPKALEDAIKEGYE